MPTRGQERSNGCCAATIVASSALVPRPLQRVAMELEQ